MRLLVSVSSAAEASAALAGGADVIDAKDPLAGALGAVSADVLREIHAIVAGGDLSPPRWAMRPARRRSSAPPGRSPPRARRS